MAFTLGFHILLACMGVAFPAITLAANWWGLRKNDPVAIELARRWSKVMGVLFAVGAITGTVLSFEMGVLWPGLMSRFGDVFGVAFAIEGIFFFTEAIFLAIYIYGWDRLSPRAHLLSGIPVVVAGLGGAAAVVSANSWMNQPAGFDMDAAGRVTGVRPLEVLANGAAPYEIPHMILAAYMVAGFTVASIYAAGMLRGRTDRHHRLGFIIPFTVAAIATPLQLFVGDLAARGIAGDQPAKFASMEYVEKTGPNQPEIIGGIFSGGEVKYGISIPNLDSLLVGFSPDTVVKGMEEFPAEDLPPSPTLLHLAFDAMVGIGTALLGLAVWFAFVWWRRRELPRSRWFLRAAAGAGLAAALALECGWIVTEVGRQPFVVYGLLRTEDAVTTSGGIWFTFVGSLVLYASLAVITTLVLRRMARRWREEGIEEHDVPYGPPVT
ncbi:MAG: cytochrome ubiquinol oxidase subunit I [Thermoleophilaceae bacterium]|nr:cytochrome ubiquinol oxidase subunit I [Thermoleophilaceae bacterium]